jgi:hypothetical protein
MRPVRRQI